MHRLREAGWDARYATLEGSDIRTPNDLAAWLGDTRESTALAAGPASTQDAEDQGGPRPAPSAHYR